jgi:periplasmic divalent cation tolerance protein
MESAEAIGRALVNSGLAAAVNVVPGATSIYRWRGELQQRSEVVLLIKTSAARYPQVEERVQAMHPYELPGILALSVADGGSEYLQWIDKQTSEPS